MTPEPAKARSSLRVRLLGALLQTAIVGLITAALLEGIVAYSFRNPPRSLIPGQLLRYLHVQFDRPVIQVMPACAMYDSQVTYRLRPGHCTFASREFSNELSINSLGTRDDDASLQHPEVVALGDSLTMGWGVDQEQTFPQVFEKLTGRRTLNAGISSFGTARELKFLERIDRSAMTDLIIQYTDNDLQENQQFATTGKLRILSEEHYNRTVDDHRRARRYYPGKYAFNLMVQIRSMLSQRMAGDGGTQPRAGRTDALEAEMFVRVLEQSPVAVDQARVTVLAVGTAFIEAARQRAAGSNAAWVRRVTFVDFEPLRREAGTFYPLDDHPTAKGHDAIARELARLLAPGHARGRHQ
jgi:lysophospholipase L1-like esterase